MEGDKKGKEERKEDSKRQKLEEQDRDDGASESELLVDMNTATKKGESVISAVAATAVNGDDDDNDDNNDPDSATASKRKRKRKRKRKTTNAEAEDEDDDKDDKDNEEEGNTNDDTANDAVEHTVFVEGIPFDCTPDDLKNFFAQNGVDDVIQLRLPTWQDSGRLRGFGHVKLGSSRSYDMAINTLNGQYMGKRYLNIQPANAPSSRVVQSVTSQTLSSSKTHPPDCQTLFLANLPYTATEEEIFSAVKKAVPKISLPSSNDNDAAGTGSASSCVRIAKNSVTHQSKGFGYLDLPNPDDARQVMNAAAKRPIKVGGRVIRLDYDTNGRIKGSYRSDSGRLWSKEQREREQHQQQQQYGGGRNNKRRY
jgi:nucleolin